MVMNSIDRPEGAGGHRAPKRFAMPDSARPQPEKGGVDLYTISRLLGHGHISTTTRYLHLISPQFKPTPDVDPLDLLAALTPF